MELLATGNETQAAASVARAGSFFLNIFLVSTPIVIWSCHAMSNRNTLNPLVNPPMNFMVHDDDYLNIYI